MTQTIDLTDLVLYSGSHDKDDPRCCFMEASAILKCALDDPTPAATWAEAYARFRACKTDHPPADSPTVAAIMRQLNDWMTNDERAQLIPYELRVAGCLGNARVEECRVWIVVDHAIRTDAAEVCGLLKMPEREAALRGLDPIVNRVTLKASLPALASALDLARALALALDLDLALDLALARALALALDLALARDLARALALALDLALARDLARDLARARGAYITDRLSLVEKLLAVTT